MRACLLGLGGHTNSHAFRVFCFRKIFNWSMNTFLILQKVNLSHKMQWQYKRNKWLLQSKHCLWSFWYKFSYSISLLDTCFVLLGTEQGIHVSISCTRWSLDLAPTSIWGYFRLQKSIKGKKIVSADLKIKERSMYMPNIYFLRLALPSLPYFQYSLSSSIILLLLLHTPPQT